MKFREISQSRDGLLFCKPTVDNYSEAELIRLAMDLSEMLCNTLAGSEVDLIKFVLSKKPGYVSRQEASEILMMLQSEERDNFEELVSINYKIWMIKRKVRMAEDKLQVCLEYNNKLTRKKKMLKKALLCIYYELSLRNL